MDELLKLCRENSSAGDEQGHKLLTYMERKYKTASKSFKSSQKFLTALNEAAKLITNNPRKKFVYLTQIISDLKSNQASTTSSEDKTSHDFKGDQSAGENGACLVDVENEEKKEKLERRIKRLEELLEEHRKAISVEEHKEISLDDLENDSSSYLIAERLKARYMKIYKRLCQLRNYSESLGGIRDKSFRYSGSRYKELNYHVQRFINKHSFEERMPDFNDIRKITSKCNDKYAYRLSKKRVQEIAKEIFLEVGNIIQRSRKEDFVADFGYSSELNDLMRRSDGDDPALISSSLRHQLNQNKKVAEKRMADIFNEFSEKQVDEMNKPPNKKRKTDNEESGEGEGSDDSGSNSESEESSGDNQMEEGEEEEILNSIAEEVAEGRLDCGDSGTAVKQSDDETDDEQSLNSKESAHFDENEEDLGELSGLDQSSSSDDEDPEPPNAQHSFTGKGKALVNGAQVCKNPHMYKEPEIIELSDSD